MIPAVELRLFVVKPVAEIVPTLIEIPEPAVNPSCTPRPVISAFVIFNFENGIAAVDEMSAFTIVPSVIFAEVIDPSTIFVPLSPVNPLPSPTNAVAVTVPDTTALFAVSVFNALDPVTEVTVPPKVIVVLPNIVVLFAN